MTFKELKTAEVGDRIKILYWCDGKACKESSISCRISCFHTSDISHAISFNKEQGRKDGEVSYFEKNPMRCTGCIYDEKEDCVCPIDCVKTPNGYSAWTKA